jgi:hypothetical protein
MLQERRTMTTITKMIETCGGCPSQWDGWDEDGAYFYFRYRWGYLRVDSHDPDGRPTTIFGKEVGDGMDGVMSYEALKFHLEGVLELPETESFPDQEEQAS